MIRSMSSTRKTCAVRLRMMIGPSMRTGVLLCSFGLLSSPALGELSDEQYDFVQANIIGIFYHELGHAVIDTEDVPIFGQEEDAADVLSVLLIDETFEDAVAQDIAFDAAFGYLNDPAGLQEVIYWDTHGPDEQRFYNHVCLFYGAEPDTRRDLAAELGLPEERAVSCPDEFDQALDSWGAILDEMSDRGPGATLQFVQGSGRHADLLNDVIGEEVRSFNTTFSLSHPVAVRVASCGEANAFYDPGGRAITMCTEFVDHLLELEGQL